MHISFVIMALHQVFQCPRHNLNITLYLLLPLNVRLILPQSIQLAV